MRKTYFEIMNEMGFNANFEHEQLMKILNDKVIRILGLVGIQVSLANIISEYYLSYEKRDIYKMTK